MFIHGDKCFSHCSSMLLAPMIWLQFSFNSPAQGSSKEAKQEKAWQGTAWWSM